MKRVRLYLCMVGGGLVIELFLLHLGRDLTTSQSIGGDWTLRIERTAGHSPCAALQPGRTLPMSITQSGRDVEIDMPGTPALKGRIQGRGVRAVAGDPLCASQAMLSSLVDAQAPFAMRGAIELASTSPPTRAWFTATRVKGARQ
jgi:hypothetical protein